MSDFLDELGEEIFMQETGQPHVFSQEYEDRKKFLLKQAKKHPKSKLLPMAAGIVGVCCMVPITVLGANVFRNYVMQHRDVGSYEDVYSFTQAEGTRHEVIHVKVLTEFPMEYIQEESGKPDKHYSTKDGRNIVLQLYYAKAQNKIVLDNVLYSEELEIDGRRAVYSEVYLMDATEASLDKNFLIFFEDYGYAVQLWGSALVERQELLELCKGISLQKTTLDMADEACFLTGNETMGGPDRDIRQGRKVQDGESFLLRACDNSMTFAPVEITIDGVMLIDSLAEVENGTLINFMSGEEYIDEDGRLLPYERRKIRQGDGVNTLSEVADTELVEQQLIKVTYTVRNLQDVERALWMEHILTLYRQPLEEGYTYDRGNNGLGALGYPIMMDNIEILDFSHADITSKQKCVVVPANESRTIQAVFVADKDNMENLCFSIGSGNDFWYEVK